MIVADTIYQIFAPLFTVKFVHTGYETPAENFLQQGIFVKPDIATQQFFTDYKMNYRFYNNTLICFIQSILVNPPAKLPKTPLFSIAGNVHFRFLLQTRNDFFGKTNIVAAGGRKIYQFSNKTNNTSGTDLFLHNPVESYAAASDYNTGTIVQDSGNLYSPIKPVLATEGIALANTAYWKKLGTAEAVVNNADLQSAASVGVEENCFAVIDMYNNGTTNTSYDLFNTGGELFNNAPAFTIKFSSKF